MVIRGVLPLAMLGLLVTGSSADMPTQDLQFGGEVRLRAEGFDNALDLEDEGDSVAVSGGWASRNDAYEYLRYRARIWMKAAPREGLAMFFRVGNEYRFGRGENTSGVKDPESKLSLDNAWAQISHRRMALTFGRMDLQYGEGFLVFDGTPADGSSSAWFDAIRLSVARPLGGVDLFFAQIDEEGFGGSSRDEDLFGVYAMQGWVETYILRRMKQQGTTSTSGTPRPSGATTAIGARLVRQHRQGLSCAIEAAYQRGDVEDVKREGYGGYGRIVWRGSGKRAPGIELGGVYLTGDDPATDRYEGWDGFYAEWPKYSELLVYTLYDNTTRVVDATGVAWKGEPGTWTNMIAGWIEAGVNLLHGRLSARAFPVWAEEGGVGPGPGNERGLLLAAKLELPLGEGVHAQVLGEMFNPGDFYPPDADHAYYGRWQLTAQF